jgi:hypothetical protein
LKPPKRHGYETELAGAKHRAGDDVDFACRRSGNHEIRLDLSLRAEREAIGLSQSGPFRPRKECVVRRHRQRRGGGKVGDRVDA